MQSNDVFFVFPLANRQLKPRDCVVSFIDYSPQVKRLMRIVENITIS